ncbi:ATP-binding protein [Streptomyces dangxiongensis]|uniref:ATP-binding protein n=1 Tax=Streptomyces dangxiongensis TaxID=1442032 RepID=A0A3G2J668_9ACTN|nr:ATP-binding protein [Streptomyces dangxiongensis]AYN37688.1 ATP-binding protein [Streptomyces dangxiongensis]AYN43379.1 ATP-binding protein [Streptomyces dangxiongensis]
MTSTQPTAPAPHYLSLPDARTVTTQAVRAAAHALDKVLREQSMMCLTADPGVGKTFTLHTLCEQRPTLPALRLLQRPQARPDDLRHSLHHALNLPGDPPQDAGICDDYLRHALAHTPRLLAVDEAHQLSTSCIEYLRYLHDDPTPQVTILLLASRPRLKALRSQPTLLSRVTTWHHMEPLDPDEVLTVLPAFHPLWHNTPNRTLTHLDEMWAHGNLRRWAALTHQLQAHRRRHPDHPPDPDALLRRLHHRLALTT